MRRLLLFALMLVFSNSAWADIELDPRARAIDDIDLGLSAFLKLEGALFNVSNLEPALGLEAGVLLRDEGFTLGIIAPVFLRPGLRTCEILRCEGYQNANGQFDYTLLSRLLRVELGQKARRSPSKNGSTIVRFGARLEIAPMRTTFGHGALLDGMINSPVFDKRQSALYASAEASSYKAEMWWAGLLRPLDVHGARFEISPHALGKGENNFLRRIRSGITYVGDYQKSAQHDDPLVGLSLDAFWPLLHTNSPWQITPRLVGSALYGLSRIGSTPTFGVGAHAGTRIDMRFSRFALRLDGRVGIDGDAHRTAVFSPLYMVRRNHHFDSDNALAALGAKQGTNAALSMSFVIDRYLDVGARVVLDQNRLGSRGEFFADLALSTLRASTLLSFNEAPQTLAPSYAAASLNWGFYGPFSLNARWLRSPRNFRSVDDFGLGASCALVFD